MKGDIAHISIGYGVIAFDIYNPDAVCPLLKHQFVFVA